jgi:S-adenosylmethionine hydrolase
VVLAVVDPGVGSERRGLVLVDGGRRWVGPDNGLLALIARSGSAHAYQLPMAAASMSASFHGRDLFAPVAARLALGESPDWEPLPLDRLVGAEWPAQLAEVIYIDDFGNCMTGLRADAIGHDVILQAGSHLVGHARTFSDVAPGAAFWFGNSSGLVEIAVNLGRADSTLQLGQGTAIGIIPAGLAE